ncbi:hypothetical protein E8E11_000915 [Didymella keratinophila]|nr:hypothetical protein E8E11_000915 [Didymella keratinophila]
MSQPIDPDAPTFLTTFPVEICNAVYQVLFKRDTPVEIMDLEKYRTAQAWCEDYEDDSDLGEDEKNELEASIEEHKKKNLFDFGPNLALLSLSTDILRGNWRPIDVAAKFCQAIGSTLADTSKLNIDIDRLCPLEYRDTTVMEILPLLSVIWSRPQVAGRKFHERVHDDADYEGDIDLTVSQINSIFHAFCQADSLVVRRYGRYERLIRRICFDLDVDGDNYTPTNQIAYRTGHRQYFEWATTFETDKSYAEIRPCVEAKSVSKDLPNLIQDRILRYAMKSHESIDFDLHRRTVTGLNTGLLGLGRSIRNHVLDTIRQLNRITLHVRRLNVNLTDLRVNVLTFIHLTYSMTLNTVVRISVGSLSVVEAYEINLQTLRRRCSILLSVAMVLIPGLGQLSAPEIWINGVGAFIQLRWPV